MASLKPSAKYTYLRVHISGVATASERPAAPLDELVFRKSVQDALGRMFGTSYAAMYLDVLNLRYGRGTASDKDGDEPEGDAVIRVACEDAPCLKAALATCSVDATRFAVVGEADFLPALLASSPLAE